tara:strand:- start:82 stop:351 length:270 start_codon:yes stop_codon:yes gene_type:complete
MDTKKVVIELLADKALLNACEISMEGTLAELGMDSMSIVEFLFSVEEQLDIDFDLNLNLDTFNDFGHVTVREIINLFEEIVVKKDVKQN